MKNLKASYNPLFTGLHKNLKRRDIWNCAEVHSIYAWFYFLGMSKEGIRKMRFYLSAEDPKTFEPLFIAQYLIVPVNTIVKKYLHPWMMKAHGPKTSDPNTRIVMSEGYCAKLIKSEIYLKCILLMNLMEIVKKYGRNPNYNFETDEKLNSIRCGEYSDLDNNKNKDMLAFDGFMTIWLLTLPEKFQE